MSITLPFDFGPSTPRVRDLPQFVQNHRARTRRSNPSRKSNYEQIADPEEISSFARRRTNRLNEYFGSRKPAPRDPRDGLPVLPEDNASSLARRYGTSPERLSQALALESHGHRSKARRLVLCGMLGHRINHQTSRGACNREYYEPYFCREKYCTFCGAQQFRELFARLKEALTPVTERLICEGSKNGRRIVIAKLDFTIPNNGQMPTPQQVRNFHTDMRRLWRAAERQFGIKRSEYGIVRCDELGGSNTNLHCHCAYVGPWLPQKNKQLSTLWSKIRRERSFVSIKAADSFAGALAHALKYAAKFLDKSSPERLAALENTFHKTRRVSTGGAFYRVKSVHGSGEIPEHAHSCCPFCKVRLVVIHETWQPLSTLEKEGRTNLRAAVREVGLLGALGNQSPP